MTHPGENPDDPHVAVVVPVAWRAECRCGWKGPEWDYPDPVFTDCKEHLEQS